MYASELIQSMANHNRMLKAQIRAEKNKIKRMKRLAAEKKRLMVRLEKASGKTSEAAELVSSAQVDYMLESKYKNNKSDY